MSVGLAVERLGNNGESIGGGPVRSSGVEGRTPQPANEEISGRDLMCVCGPIGSKFLDLTNRTNRPLSVHTSPTVLYSFWILQPW